MRSRMRFRDQLRRALDEDHPGELRTRHQARHYLSMEFLIGRTLGIAMLALELTGASCARRRWSSMSTRACPGSEPDAALGNGSLGRLAACFLDSLAALRAARLRLRHPLRLRHVFRQQIVGGQHQNAGLPAHPHGNPWEFRPEVRMRVRFSAISRGTRGPGALGGHRTCSRWLRLRSSPALRHRGHRQHLAPVVGPRHRGDRPLRLQPRQLFRAVRQEPFGERPRVLLPPDDSTLSGRELRLRQEYSSSPPACRTSRRRYLDQPRRFRCPRPTRSASISTTLTRCSVVRADAPAGR